MRQSYRRIANAAVALALIAAGGHVASAADNRLAPEEQQAGWQLLFDGESLSGWKNSNDAAPPAGVVKDGTLNPHNCGGYLLVYERPIADFELKCDVLMVGQNCNSGVFLRVADLKDPVQTGLEVQVLSPPGQGLHDFGAVYDLVAPAKIATREPGQWNTLHIKCDGPRITVAVNGQLVTEMDCDEFIEPGKRPDGTSHKFTRAVKDFARAGYFGFQNHGSDVWYRNIKLREIK